MNTVSYNFSIAALSRLILGGISLVIIGLLTRALGPAGYGQYSLVFAYLYVFTALADLGFYTITVREIAKTGADESAIVSRVFSLRLLFIALFLVLGGLLVLALPYSAEVKLGIWTASLFAVFSSSVQILTGVFQKHLRLYFVSLADVIARALQLGLLLLAIPLRPGLLTLIWIVVISEAFHFLLVFWFSRTLVKIKLVADFNYWQKTLKSSLPIAASLVFVLLYFKMDTVLLSLMKPVYDVGVYSAAYKILETVIFLPAAYIGLVMPILSRYALDNKIEFQRTFRRSFNTLAIFALPTMAYLILRAGDIMRLIGGNGFGQSAAVLQILSLAIMLIFFGNLGGNALVALDLQKKGMWIYFTGAIFNVGANLLLIPRYSYFATAWTTVLTELLITIAMFWLIKKETAAAVKWKVFGKAALATGITAAIIYPLKLSLFYATSLALIYFPILFILKGFSKDDLVETLSLGAKKLPFNRWPG